jgi:hypothetical protein
MIVLYCAAKIFKKLNSALLRRAFRAVYAAI